MQFCVLNQYEPVNLNQACVCAEIKCTCDTYAIACHVHVSMHAYAYILMVCKFHGLACIYDDNTRKSPAGVGGCGGRRRLCPAALSGMIGPCGESWRSGESRREDGCQTFNAGGRLASAARAKLLKEVIMKST